MDTKSFLGFTYYAFEESFRYKDLQHVSVHMVPDWYLLMMGSLWLGMSISWFSLLAFSHSIQDSDANFTLWDIFGFVFLGLALLFFIGCWRKMKETRTLVLDFYRDEVVPSWLSIWKLLTVTSYAGSYLTRRLRLPRESCQKTMDFLHDHRLTQYAEDRHVPGMDAQLDENQEIVAVGRPFVRATPLETATSTDISYAFGFKSIGFRPLAGEIIYFVAKSGSYCLAEEQDICSWFAISSTLVITDRRIYTRIQRRFFGFAYREVEESFRYKDLKHVAVQKGDPSFRLLVGTLWTLVFGVLPGLVDSLTNTEFGSVSVTMLFTFNLLLDLVGIGLILVGLLEMFCFHFVALNIYKKEVVGSWWLSSLATKIGSSTHRRIPLTESQCYHAMHVLLKHEKARLVEEPFS